MATGNTPQIQDYFADLNSPDMADLQIQLEQLVNQGILTPDMAQAVLQGPSAMEDIQTDGGLRTKQMDSLAALEDIIAGGGLTLADQANLNKIQNQEQQAARGAQEAILSNAQARGMGGSGLEMMAQIKNRQDAATRTANRDMDIAAQAQERALQAIMQQGQMAGNVRGQDFNEKAQKAQAQDAISRFNAQNQTQLNQYNTGVRNAAQEANLANKQRISDANVGIRNAQQTHNKGLYQQQFENELKKRSAQAGIAGQNAANQGADSQREADIINSIISGGITAGAYGLKK